MNAKLRWALIALHIVVIIIALIWIWEGFNYEPLIVLIAEIIGILAITFEKRFNRLFIEDISDSKISVKTPKKTDLDIKKVKNKSEIEIK
ncbi:MAG: hypothetical protein AAGC64_02725 [Bacteroidota bacterium]